MMQRGEIISVGGIVLCGGRSKRMGRPKPWLPFGDELLLPRVVRLVNEAVEPIVVVAAQNQDLPPLGAHVTIVRDEAEDRGPVQGLAAGLKALAGRVDAAFLSSCDVPFLKPGVVRRLMQLLGDADICVPKVHDRLHPLAAVYRLHVAGSVQKLLAENLLRLTLLSDMVPTRVVTAAELEDVDPTLASLGNLNTPEDYEAALRAHLRPEGEASR